MFCPGGVSPHRMSLEFFTKPAESNMCQRVKRNRLISPKLVSGQTLSRVFPDMRFELVEESLEIMQHVDLKFVIYLG